MKTKLLFTVLLSVVFYLTSAQIPQGFNYQAIARDGSGNPIINQSIPVMLTIQSDSLGGIIFWEELHSPVTTNAFGLFTINLGKGVRQPASTVAAFKDIDWTVTPKYLFTRVNWGGWKNMGSARLWSVPYSMVSANLSGPLKKLAVTGATTSPDSVLFEVKNKNGQTVFVVYNEGVRIYVDDGIAKGSKGGFAIGGFGTAKAPSQNLFIVSSDSIRAYINDNPLKAKKGGFAIGGFDKTKGGNASFMNVATDAGGIINPSQNRVLWYPIKNAFLAGKVLIENPDSVGINSFSTGFESKAVGQYSQALGYKAFARGDYSTAIGMNSIAQGGSSYAFGTGARATGLNSFALGSVGVDSLGTPTGQTLASGESAFALGLGSKAKGIGAFAVGLNNSATGNFSLATGYLTTADGPFSTTMGGATQVEPSGWFGTAAGFLTKAGSWTSASFGDQTYASGHTSFATGYKSIASGHLSSALGLISHASGTAAVSMGDNTTAQAYASLVIGRYNTISGLTDSWNFWDPEFVIGNGSSAASPSNALTVYKNGIADLGWFINLNTASTSTGGAIYVNNAEALWYDGTYFSWGFGGTYNYFADKVTIGNSANPGYMLYVQGSAYSTGSWTSSDLRWKKNLQPLNNEISGLMKLNGYKYNWRKDEFPEMNFESETQLGLVAQEVERVFPELVRTDNKGYKSVSYEKLSVLLLAGMKEQQVQIDSQNQKISKLEKLVDQLMAEKEAK